MGEPRFPRTEFGTVPACEQNATETFLAKASHGGCIGEILFNPGENPRGRPVGLRRQIRAIGAKTFRGCGKNSRAAPTTPYACPGGVESTPARHILPTQHGGRGPYSRQASPSTAPRPLPRIGGPIFPGLP